MLVSVACHVTSVGVVKHAHLVGRGVVPGHGSGGSGGEGGKIAVGGTDVHQSKAPKEGTV